MVVFVDTSILCNLIPVPGKDQDSAAVRAELAAHVKARHTMILPVTTVIEAGNHIAQLSNGDDRRKAAVTFAGILALVRDGTAPWVPHEFAWDSDFIRRLIAGASTGSDLVGLLTQRVGGGDLSILVERDLYRSRTRLTDVTIWTKDAALRAYA